MHTVCMQPLSDLTPGLQIAATCKHFAAYSLEQEDGITRKAFDAQVSDRYANLPGLGSASAVLTLS